MVDNLAVWDLAPGLLGEMKSTTVDSRNDGRPEEYTGTHASCYISIAIKTPQSFWLTDEEVMLQYAGRD